MAAAMVVGVALACPGSPMAMLAFRVVRRRGRDGKGGRRGKRVWSKRSLERSSCGRME